MGNYASTNTSSNINADLNSTNNTLINSDIVNLFGYLTKNYSKYLMSQNWGSQNPPLIAGALPLGIFNTSDLDSNSPNVFSYGVKLRIDTSKLFYIVNPFVNKETVQCTLGGTLLAKNSSLQIFDFSFTDDTYTSVNLTNTFNFTATEDMYNFQNINISINAGVFRIIRIFGNGGNNVFIYNGPNLELNSKMREGEINFRQVINPNTIINIQNDLSTFSNTNNMENVNNDVDTIFKYAYEYLPQKTEQIFNSSKNPKIIQLFIPNGQAVLSQFITPSTLMIMEDTIKVDSSGVYLLVNEGNATDIDLYASGNLNNSSLIFYTFSENNKNQVRTISESINNEPMTLPNGSFGFVQVTGQSYIDLSLTEIKPSILAPPVPVVATTPSTSTPTTPSSTPTTPSSTQKNSSKIILILLLILILGGGVFFYLKNRK